MPFAWTFRHPGVAQHPQPFQQAGGIMFGTGTVNTSAGTGEHFDENRLAARKILHTGKSEFQILQPGQRSIMNAVISALKADRVVHAAFDRVASPLFRRLRQEPILRFRNQPFRFNRRFAQHLAQFRIGERQIEQFRIAVRFVLLSDAGPDENHPDSVAEGIAQQSAVGHERRTDRRDGRRQMREVATDKIHRRRTGRREPQPTGAGVELFRHPGGDKLGAERGFADPGKSEHLQRPDQFSRLEIAKFADPRRRDGSVDRSGILQQQPGTPGVVAHLFGLDRTHFDALAAGDAEFGDDRGMAVAHPDRFHRTVADTFVTVLALRFDGVDRIGMVHGVSAPQFGIQKIDQRLGIHPFEIFAVDGEIRTGFALADAAAPGEGTVDRVLPEIFFDDLQISFVAPGKAGAAHADDDGVFHSLSSSKSAP